MSEQHGYFGLVLPADLQWQGLYLTPAYLHAAEDAVQRSRAEMIQQDGSIQSDNLARHGLSRTDDALVGAFCSALYHANRRCDKDDVGICFHAVHLLVQKNYFGIISRPVGPAIQSTVIFLNASTTKGARAALKQLPAVQIIETRKNRGRIQTAQTSLRRRCVSHARSVTR